MANKNYIRSGMGRTSDGSPIQLWSAARRIAKLLFKRKRRPTRAHRPNEPQRGARNPDGTRR